MKNVLAERPIHVLIADDMPAMRTIVREMLEKMGILRSAEAEDGEIAWKMIHESALQGDDPFDLVIVDWKMPEINGMELLKAVRSFSLTRDLPFVMITAQADRYSLAEARHAGASELLVKPFVGAQLAQVILRLNPSMAPLIERKLAVLASEAAVAPQSWPLKKAS